MNQTEARKLAAEIGGVATYDGDRRADQLPSREWVVIAPDPETGDWKVVARELPEQHPDRTETQYDTRALSTMLGKLLDTRKD